MRTGLDPRVLRARACEHGARPFVLTDLGVGALGRGSCLRVTGLSSPALNGALVSGVTAEDDLRRVVTALGDLPATVLVPPADAGRCAAAAAAAGLEPAGEVPVMDAALDPKLLSGVDGRGVERAVDHGGLDEAAHLIAVAFGDESTAPRLAPPGDSVDVWVRREDGRVRSAVVVTVDPDLLGVWAVATDPSARGAGRAESLLRAVLGHYALEGIPTAFFLAPGGARPIAEALGFEVAEQWHAWLKPASAQRDPGRVSDGARLSVGAEHR